MRVENDASLPQLREPRHHVFGDVVGPQAIDDDDEMGVTGLVLRGGVHLQVDQEREKDEQEPSKLFHALQLRRLG